MIPIRLTIKNFMCYGDNPPSLEFENIHVACLCGDNGHGKTSILDAITWSLWGQARARSHEELIHQGKLDMSVDLEFEALNQEYRVSRKYSKSKRSRQGATLLELQVKSGETYSPITENTVRDTERRIRDILHMDYDTFVNTAFLMQGQADMFTKSTPSQRKETLAEVLGLSAYQKLESMAKDKSRNAQDKIRDIDTALEIRHQETEQKSQYQEQKKSTEAILKDIEPKYQECIQKMQKLSASIQLQKEQLGELKVIELRSISITEKIENLGKQIKLHQERIQSYELAISRKTEIQENFHALENATSEMERLNNALTQKIELDRIKAQLEQGLAVKRQSLISEQEQEQARLNKELLPRSKRASMLLEDISKLKQQESELETSEQTTRLQQGQAENISAKAEHLKQSNAALIKEMEDTRNKFDLLGEEKAICPLCQQHMGQDAKKHLQKEYEDSGKKAKIQYKKTEDDIKKLQLQHENLKTQISDQHQANTDNRQQLQGKIALADINLSESKAAERELQPSQNKISQLRKKLETGEFAADEQKKLSEINSTLSRLEYDTAKHQNIQTQIKKQEKYRELNLRLLESEAALPKEQKELDLAMRFIESLQQQSLDIEDKRRELSKTTSLLHSQESDFSDMEKLSSELESQRQSARVKEGILKEQLDRITAAENELLELTKERSKLATEKSIYDELTVAFGKNGIQALIIESSIPQIQNDANELLGRLTENRMFLKLQLKEGRKERLLGIPSEELEILIGDEVGTRSYETFSGGEGFRINFALRIALSKLLARRSGAPLPILFIDEGFGSQDYAGQERLKEAIQSIQSDFQKIIVITHVEQVKESFPTRIEVTKTGSGSTFTII